MNYPTTEQIESAGHEQLGRWVRFLPSPGDCAIGTSYPDFEKKHNEEKIKLEKIMKRFKSFGGMSPSLSKKIGWVK